jgi:hypothetical protein
VGKPLNRPENDPQPGLCLTQGEVGALKAMPPIAWHGADKLPTALKAKLPGATQVQEDVGRQGTGAVLDRALRDLSCWTCRIFGSSWLASKVLIKDLMLDEGSFYRTEIRDGVGIDRDSGRAADGFKYQFEVVPVGTAFSLEVLVENATEAELGLLWLGIHAFEQGQVLMGGARSRGLGWCRLLLTPEECEYVTAGTLLDALLPPAQGPAPATQLHLDAQPRHWIEAFFEAIGAQPATEGEQDA